MGILDDKAVLITGAASGIGRATAEAAHAEGARLLLSDVDDEEGAGARRRARRRRLLRQLRRHERGRRSRRSVARDVDELGRLDGAFNCAGILGTLGTTDELRSTAGSGSSTSTSTASSSAPSTSCRVMAEQGSGSILNMASAAGLIGWPGAVRLRRRQARRGGPDSKAAALEYARAGHPGQRDLPLLRRDADGRERPLRGHPRQRPGADRRRPREPPDRPLRPAGGDRRGCVWLLSDKASFVTGTAMSVDGGYTAP